MVCYSVNDVCRICLHLIFVSFFLGSQSCKCSIWLQISWQLTIQDRCPFPAGNGTCPALSVSVMQIGSFKKQFLIYVGREVTVFSFLFMKQRCCVVLSGQARFFLWLQLHRPAPHSGKTAELSTRSLNKQLAKKRRSRDPLDEMHKPE